MAEVIKYWAGEDRLFRLDVGAVLDLETVLDCAFGSLYVRMVSSQWSIKDVMHILRVALIAGGHDPVKAKILVHEHFDMAPYIKNYAVAVDIVLAVVDGVEETGDRATGEPEKLIFSEISQICREFNMSPHELKAMNYDDFLNMLKGFNAGPKKAQPPTEEEFRDILARHEPEALLDAK